MSAHRDFDAAPEGFRAEALARVSASLLHGKLRRMPRQLRRTLRRDPYAHALQGVDHAVWAEFLAHAFCPTTQCTSARRRCGLSADQCGREVSAAHVRLVAELAKVVLDLPGIEPACTSPIFLPVSPDEARPAAVALAAEAVATVEPVIAAHAVLLALRTADILDLETAVQAQVDRAERQLRSPDVPLILVASLVDAAAAPPFPAVAGSSPGPSEAA